MHGESRRGPPSSLVQHDVDWSLFLFLFFKHIMLIVTTVVLLFFLLLDQFFFFFFQNEITNWFFVQLFVKQKRVNYTWLLLTTIHLHIALTNCHLSHSTPFNYELLAQKKNLKLLNEAENLTHDMHIIVFNVK